MQSFAVIWILSCIFAALANPAIDQKDNTIHHHSINRNQLEEGFVHKLNTRCSERDNHACMMLKMIVYMNRMFKKSNFEITQNLRITQTRPAESIIDSALSGVEDDLMARAVKSDDETLGVIVAEKIWRFLRSRSLRYKLYDNADIVLETEPRGNLNIGLSVSPVSLYQEGRGRIRRLAPLIALVATKVGVIGALAFKALVLLVGKALVVSKIALLVAAIIALKKLLTKKHVTYEVIAHPQHPHPEPPHNTVHDSYSTGWGRALEGFLDGIADAIPEGIRDNDVQNLIFSKQKP